MQLADLSSNERLSVRAKVAMNLERRLTTLMQQQQQQLADLNERLALPSPEDVNEKRHTRAVLAGIVDVLGRLYRRGG